MLPAKSGLIVNMLRYTSDKYDSVHNILKVYTSALFAPLSTFPVAKLTGGGGGGTFSGVTLVLTC